MMIKMKRRYTKIKCPKCKSDNIASYQYGLVEMDPELKKDLDKGKIVMGGCFYSEDNPQLHCNQCEYDW